MLGFPLGKYGFMIKEITVGILGIYSCTFFIDRRFLFLEILLEDIPGIICSFLHYYGFLIPYNIIHQVMINI